MTPLRTYGVADVAELLGKSQDWVGRRCASHEFPHLRVGKSIRFTEAHLAQILAQMEQPSASTATPIGLTRRSRAHQRRRRSTKAADSA